MDSKTLINRRTRRTTLTLEADVADYISKKLSVNKDLKEKNVVNDLLRKGIMGDFNDEHPRFEIVGFKTKLASGISKHELEGLLDEI
ncbi:hypothetical protein BH10ACI3_BH10ACI3_01360 [soil metagenome]